MFADLFSFEPSRYFFNRCGIYDMRPYKLVEQDGELILILNTLGIDEKDIQIEPEPDHYGNYALYLKVTGKTKNPITEEEHSISMRFGSYKEISSVEHESKDGLTYLKIKFVEPVAPKVSISNKKLLAG